MKSSNIDRRVRSAAAKHVEMLENRCLLSATLLTPVPTQDLLTASGNTTQVNLATFLNDPQVTGGTVIEMQTPLGNIPFQLFDSQTPQTVANFTTYITNGDYQPTIIQRSAPGFVLQGGGTKTDGSNISAVGTMNSSGGTVVGEPGISNTTGTIAMALSNGPDSGTNQWFINLGNNSVLDGTQDGGPFTVFGTAIDNGLSVANAISQLQIIDGSAENQNWFIGQNDGLPVLPGYTGPTTLVAGSPISPSSLVTDNVVEIPTGQAVTYTAVGADPAIVTASVTNGVLTLAAAAGVTKGSTTVTATVTDLSGATATSTFTVGVNLIPTTSTVVASAPTAIAGSSVTLTATVAPTASGPALGGNVVFFSGTTQLDSPAAVSGGTAVLTTTSLPAGTDSVSAIYVGDANYLTSTSPAISESVVAPTLTGTLTGATASTVIATTPLKLHEKLTLTAGSSGATGTGSATILLSPDESAADSVLTLGTTTATVKLKSGKAINRNVKLPKTVPSTVAAGTYHVLITTTDTGNNVVATDSGQTITVVAPVVDITGSVVGPTTAKIGKKTRFTILVTNASTANVAAVGTLPFDTATSPDGQLSDATPLVTGTKHVNLKPGKSVKIFVTTTLSASTFLIADLDPGNVVFANDTNTANNIFSSQIIAA